MKKTLMVLTALFFLISGANLADAAKAPKPAKKTTQQDLTANEQIDAMQNGFAFNGGIDVKIFDMINANFGETSDWYFYPTYRMAVAQVFGDQNFGLLADVEKPGYANITYPFIKVNELYAKFQQETFYVKLGRQEFGDKDDLLLGFQHDAITLGFDLDTVDLLFFIARTDLLLPWNASNLGGIESMIGFTPYFTLGEDMGLKGYLLIGNEPITITSGTPPTSNDSVNTLIQVGGKFGMDMPSENSNFGLDAQLGVQFAMAKTAGDDSIDATGIGLKLDADYESQSSKDFGFKIAGHVVYTSGDPDPLVNTKAGFASLNSLVGSGPGLFSKIQDGAGPYTYLDGNNASIKIQNYVGVMAFGVSGEFIFNETIEPGIGLWIYSNTDDNGESLGTEFDVWLNYLASEVVKFYAQFATFIPNRDGIGWPPSPATGPNSAIKFLVGSSINF